MGLKMTLVGRLPEKRIIIGLAIYECIDLSHEAVRDVAMKIPAELSRT